MKATLTSWSLRFLAIVLTGAVALSPAACDSSSEKDKSNKSDDDKDDDEDKDDDDDEDDDKKSKKKLEDGDDTKPAKDGKAKEVPTSSADAGAVLDYMPDDCDKGRVFIDTSSLFSDSAAQAVLRDMTTKLLAKERDADTQKAVDVLKKAGVDLATFVKGAAMCMHLSSDDPVVGFTLSVADPLGLIKDIATATGESDIGITEKDGVKTLAADDITFVQPASGILLFGKTGVSEAASAKKGGAGFATARGQVAFFFVPIEGESHMEGKVTRAGSNFNLWGALKMDAKTASQAKSATKEFEAEMRKTLLKESGELKGTPFKLIDERLQNTTFQVKDDMLIATLSVPTSDVTDLLKAAAPQIGAGDGGGAAGGEEDPLAELLKMVKKK